MVTITAKEFKEFRNLLGFTNQNDVKAFYSAKDIIRPVSFEHIEMLNARLAEIVSKLNSVVHASVRITDIQAFTAEYIVDVYRILKENNIFPRFNNLGRPPEDVYFNWMRGNIVSHFALPALAKIFGIAESAVSLVGDDDIAHIADFKKTPKADIEIPGHNLRLETQAGFQSINDIKQHKVLEARRLALEKGMQTWAVHFDFYNGQAAFVQLDTIADDDVNWVTRQQMEGQTVFAIDQNSFVWRLTDPPPTFEKIKEQIGA
ncbi:MAG: restriction endonuclease [Patescibacteria group bacterium]